MADFEKPRHRSLVRGDTLLQTLACFLAHVGAVLNHHHHSLVISHGLSTISVFEPIHIASYHEKAIICDVRPKSKQKDGFHPPRRQVGPLAMSAMRLCQANRAARKRGRG